MTRVFRAALVVALTLMATSTARAQQVAYAATVMTELDSATQAALSREINAALGRGLPAEPLLAKVREGRSKQASATLIRNAVHSLTRRLDSARVALGAMSTVEELTAGAVAIAEGADLSSLRAVRAATNRSIAAPLGTLAQLLGSRVEEKKAVAMIVGLLQRSASPAHLVALGNLVEGDVASGLRPEEAALFRLRGIEASLSFGDKAELSAPTGVGPPSTGTSTQKPQRRP